MEAGDVRGMSLADAHASVLDTYIERTEALEELLSRLSGPQQASKIQSSILNIEKDTPFSIPETYEYGALDSSDEFFARGAIIQKYQTAFDLVWEVCDDAYLISPSKLKNLLTATTDKHTTQRKRRTRREPSA